MSGLSFLEESLEQALFEAPVNATQDVVPAAPAARLYSLSGGAVASAVGAATAAPAQQLPAEGFDLFADDVSDIEDLPAFEPGEDLDLPDEAAAGDEGDLYDAPPPPAEAEAYTPTAREAQSLAKAMHSLGGSLGPMNLAELNRYLMGGQSSGVSDPDQSRLRQTIRAMMRRQV